MVGGWSGCYRMLAWSRSRTATRSYRSISRPHSSVPYATSYPLRGRPYQPIDGSDPPSDGSPESAGDQGERSMRAVHAGATLGRTQPGGHRAVMAFTDSAAPADRD